MVVAVPMYEVSISDSCLFYLSVCFKEFTPALRATSKRASPCSRPSCPHYVLWGKYRKLISQAVTELSPRFTETKQVEEEMWRNIGREQGDQHLASPPSTLGCWGWAMFQRCYFRLLRHLNKLSVSEWKLFPKIHKPSRSLIVAFSEPKYLKKPY